MEQIDNLKELINQGDVDTAIEQLDQLLQDTSVEKEKNCNRYPQLLPQGYVQSIKDMFNQ